jgi:hypothetical protein
LEERFMAISNVGPSALGAGGLLGGLDAATQLNPNAQLNPGVQDATNGAGLDEVREIPARPDSPVPLPPDLFADPGAVQPQGGPTPGAPADLKALAGAPQSGPLGGAPITPDSFEAAETEGLGPAPKLGEPLGALTQAGGAPADPAALGAEGEKALIQKPGAAGGNHVDQAAGPNPPIKLPDAETNAQMERIHAATEEWQRFQLSWEQKFKIQGIIFQMLKQAIENLHA